MKGNIMLITYKEVENNGIEIQTILLCPTEEQRLDEILLATREGCKYVELDPSVWCDMYVNDIIGIR